MQQNYYYKYIKYKKKYLQLGGNYKNNDNILNVNRCIEDTNGVFINLSECETNNIWKDNYIELYNILLTIQSEQNISTFLVKKIKSLCELLFQNLGKNYFSSNINDKRSINYNLRFIINIVSILIGNDFISSINDKIQFNKEQTLDKNNFYYLEDAFTNDLDLFFLEYDNLIINKKSLFFYRSNLVNISILLKCFSSECIKNIPKDITNIFYKKLYNQFTEEQFNNIFQDFNLKKYKIINSLLEAYKDFSYEKVKCIYINYLQFYFDNFKNLDLIVTEKDELNDNFTIIKKIIESSGNDYFIYLSCNLPSEFKFQKFECTKILISYLGFRENNDDFTSSIDIIEHDFCEIHKQYNRKISYSNKELLDLRNFYKLLYKSFELNQEVLNKIIIFIHESNYERDTNKLTITKIINQISKKFIYNVKNIHKIIYEYANNYNCLENEENEKNKFNELVNNKYFGLRLYNSLLIKNKRLMLLDENEKKILIDCLSKVTEPFIINEIKKFIYDELYTIDLSKQLNHNQILFLKKIIKHDYYTYIDYLYTFTKFLYENYNELLIDNKIYENLTKLLK